MRRVGKLRNTREAAIRLRLSRKTLANYRTLGGGPDFLRLGNRIFYDEAELESWLLARRMTTTRNRSR